MRPIYDHRTIVGYANTKVQAIAVVRDFLQTIPKGWRVVVGERDTALTGLPAGWVYSITP